MKRRSTRKIRGGAPSIPVGSENVVSMDEIKNGDEMVGWIQDNDKYTWDYGKYYKKSTYDGLPVPKLDPTTRKAITNPVFYRAAIEKAPAPFVYVYSNRILTEKPEPGVVSNPTSEINEGRINEFCDEVNKILAKGYMLVGYPITLMNLSYQIPNVVQSLQKYKAEQPNLHNEPGYCSEYKIIQVDKIRLVKDVRYRDPFPREWTTDQQGRPIIEEIDVPVGWQTYGPPFQMFERRDHMGGKWRLFQAIVKRA